MASKTIEDEIQDYKNGRLAQNFRYWSINVIDPYSLAYKRAFDSFEKTLNDQKAYDKMRVELAFFALSLCGGSIFASVFGGLAAKKVAGNVALDFICNHNLEKAFKMAKIVESNKAAQFIIGELWSGGGKLLESKTKQLFSENASNYNSIDSVVRKPYEIDASLEKFKLNCHTKFFEVLDFVHKSNMDSSIKAEWFRVIKLSHFCHPPKSDYYSNDLAENIELSFYMKYILDCDHMVTTSVYMGMGMGGSMPISQRGKSVKESPSAKNYPKGSHKSGFGYSSSTYVAYDSVGDKLVTRMNKLYKSYTKTNKDIIPDTFNFGMAETITKNTLIEAERILTLIGNDNSNLIKNVRAKSI